jgi:hypothetical protein
MIYIYKFFFNFYTPRAISITRTLFRLNTNQSFAYENYPAYLYIINIYNFTQKKSNLLHLLFSAPDEWLVPN